MSFNSSFEYQQQKDAGVGNSFADGNDYVVSYGGNDFGNNLPNNRQSLAGFGQTVDNASLAIPASLNAKHGDLKTMLESSKDGLKLEAMKRLIGMIAKGRGSSDSAARDMFPHVVKNVVTKNAELKKLVYLYLSRYAEQEQDLALLSISSFQRSLRDPNPLIRASALRVLSSIRVPIIAPIMLIAIKECSNDMSPYVRKTAAHSITKLYSLDPELREEIVLIIKKLLQDKTSLVLGSAVAAFEEICADRFDLIHPNYRKFVSLMADFDEWGQVVLLGMLVRYARTQFLDPNNDEKAKAAFDVSGMVMLDSDHRLLLRNSKPLLQSRNSAVVMAVIQLYIYIAPTSEINSLIVKPLIRLLHSRQEIQVVVLTNIATLTSGKPQPVESEVNEESDSDLSRKRSLRSLFEPYMKSFFIKARDTTAVKILKLRILTNLSSSSNIPLILREFQAYIQNYQGDMEFVSATIQAIGRCASRIREIAPVCLNGLISLLSNRNEAIVSQSIIVIRTQIISRENEDEEESQLENSTESNSSLKADSIVTSIVKQITKLMDKITTPNARATIVWILAEFCDKNLKALQVSPEVLRMMAKSFRGEADIVKLQVMNLAAKLLLTINAKNQELSNEMDIFDNKTKEKMQLLVNYVFNLGKYDLNYDVRDRGRFIKQLLNASETVNGFRFARHVLMSKKAIYNVDKGQKNFEYTMPKYRIGTLSHYLNKKVPGYEELPDYPAEQPDTSVRHGYGVDVSGAPTFELINKEHIMKKTIKENFYSDSEESEEEEEESDESESEAETSEEEESEDGEEEDAEDDAEEDEEEDEEEEDEEEEDDDEEEEEEEEEANAVVKAVNKETAVH